jgi:hypothetical protein
VKAGKQLPFSKPLAQFRIILERIRDKVNENWVMKYEVRFRAGIRAVLNNHDMPILETWVASFTKFLLFAPHTKHLLAWNP